VTAINSIGESVRSEEYMVVAATKPEPPYQLTRNEVITTKTTLSFTWLAGVSDGGSPVIDYRVWFDQSMDSWVQIATSWTQKSFTTTYLQPVTPGNYYKFKVEARNAVGYSDESEVLIMLAAIIPGAPTDVITYNDGTSVYLRWTPPSPDPVMDYGEPIRGYKVYIRHQDGVNFSIDLSSCDGENDESVIASASCIIPMSNLQAPPFNLAYGTGVLVKVVAFNSIGEGPASSLGGEAVSAIEPNAPVNLLRYELLTNINQISLTWEDGVFDGGSPVLDYQVSYD
jgi:hypothetical protein